MTKVFSFKKTAALVLISFFCFSSSLSAQNSGTESVPQNAQEYVQKTLDSSAGTSADSSADGTAVNQSAANTWTWKESSPEIRRTNSSGFALFFKMIFSLLVVIALAYGVVRFFKKTGGIADTDDPFLRKVAQISLGTGKTVQIVTLLENAYILGVTDNNVNLISKIEDKELVESLNLFADKNQNTSKPKTFADVLDIFLARGEKTKNAFSSSAKHASDILKNQRDRFNRGE